MNRSSHVSLPASLAALAAANHHSVIRLVGAKTNSLHASTKRIEVMNVQSDNSLNDLSSLHGSERY